MRKTILPLVAALFLTGPAVLGAQQQPWPSDGSAANDTERVEAEIFQRTFEAIRDYSLDSMADSVLWEKAIEGLVKELDDPYATVLDPEEVAQFQEDSTGDYAGVGITIQELNNAVTVTAVFRDTPAEQAGLQVGDRIVGVGDESAEGWSVSQASSQIRGEVGTTVEITVERDGLSEPMTLEIERDEVHVPAVTADRVFDDLGYVFVDRIARDAAAEVDSVLTELDGARGLILDLRRNPGGYLDESLSLADLFLERGSVLVNTKSRTPGEAGGTREDAGHARGDPRIPEKPIIVLVDRYTASAAEIIAGALQDHDRALVLGERTFGKGVVQTVLPLPGDRLIRLTTGEWYTPQGRSLNRPRDADGEALEGQGEPTEDYRSVGGRTLRGGGGVFPDMDIAADTLSANEREFMEAVARAEVPLTLRIHETAFDAAQRARSGEGPADIGPDVLQELVAELESSGVDLELLDDSGVKDYLLWQLRVAFFQRLDQEGRSLEVRAERDSVLAKAVELLSEAENPTDLFAYVAEREEAQEGSRHR